MDIVKERNTITMRKLCTAMKIRELLKSLGLKSSACVETVGRGKKKATKHKWHYIT